VEPGLPLEVPRHRLGCAYVGVCEPDGPYSIRTVGHTSDSSGDSPRTLLAVALQGPDSRRSSGFRDRCFT
jgi:hypothetical protein